MIVKDEVWREEVIFTVLLFEADKMRVKLSVSVLTETVVGFVLVIWNLKVPEHEALLVLP